MTPSANPSHLPPELWTLVFQWVLTFPHTIEDTIDNPDIAGGYGGIIYDTLANVSLVCSVFKKIVDPLLFRGKRVWCVVRRLEARDDAIDYLERFEDVLDQRPAAKDWVKLLDIRVHSMNSVSGTQLGWCAEDQFPKVYSLTENVLLQLHQLQNLVLDGVPISSAMLRHIADLKNLQSLGFYPSDWEEVSMEETSSPEVGPPLKRLAARSSWEDPPPLALNPIFGLLALGGDITILDVDMHILLPYIDRAAAGSSWLKVVSLSLTVSQEDTKDGHLELVLRSFPSATALSVTERDPPLSPATTQLAFSAECVPRLASIMAPWKFLQALIPGRPINSVVAKLNRSDLGLDYDVLEKNAVEVDELVLLNVRDSEFLYGNVFVSAPNLKALTVHLNDGEEGMILIETVMSRGYIMPNLAYICFTSLHRPDPRTWIPDWNGSYNDGSGSDEEDEVKSTQYSDKFDHAVAEWLHSISPILPSLVSVEFQKRRWYRTSTSEWTKARETDMDADLREEDS